MPGEKGDPMNEPEKTAQEAAAQAEVAAVAVELDALRGRLVRVRSTVDAGDAWPPEMDTGEIPRTLAYQIFANLSTLLEDHLEPGIELARLTGALTPTEVRDDWERERLRGLAVELYGSLSAAAASVKEAQAYLCPKGTAVESLHRIRQTAAELARQAAELAQQAAALDGETDDGEDGAA